MAETDAEMIWTLGLIAFILLGVAIVIVAFWLVNYSIYLDAQDATDAALDFERNLAAAIKRQLSETANGK
jgi:hypothetical protein